MDENIKRIVTDIHNSPRKGVIVITGGGVQLLYWLLATPGASRTILEASIPYSLKSLVEHQNSVADEKAVSLEVAQSLSETAYDQANYLVSNLNDVGNLFGLSITASLSTDYEKRGDVHAWIALTDKSGTKSIHVSKSLQMLNSRDRQDRKVSVYALNMLTSAIGFEMESSDRCIEPCWCNGHKGGPK